MNDSILQVVDPGHLPRNPTPPPVHVEGVVADRKRYSPGDGLRLPPLTRDLEIDYSALSFVNPAKVRFRYMLEGHDRGWQEPGTRRQAFYTDLRPGNYRFRVIACNDDGVWNKVATLNFFVAAKWYQTKWFFVGCFLGGILILWALHRLRMRQAAKALAVRFDERLSERTRSLENFTTLSSRPFREASWLQTMPWINRPIQRECVTRWNNYRNGLLGRYRRDGQR